MDLLRKAKYKTMSVNTPYISNVTQERIMTASQEGEHFVTIPKDDIDDLQVKGLKQEGFKVIYIEGDFPDECFYLVDWRVTWFEKLLLKVGLM